MAPNEQVVQFFENINKLNVGASFSVSMFVILFSVILHEIAHGYAALKLGDPTAYLAGRLTLNPIPHIDLWMTIIMPISLYIASAGSFMLGGAKPVPVNFSNLRHYDRDIFLVGAAGPLTNIILMLVAMALLMIVFALNIDIFFIKYFLFMAVVINLSLAIFNLLPIPPLDGSRIIRYFLPRPLQQMLDSLENFGMFILIAVVMLGLHNYVMGPIFRFFTYILVLSLNVFASLGA